MLHDFAAMAEALSRSADFRVLRRLVPRSVRPMAHGPDVRFSTNLDQSGEPSSSDYAK